MSKKAPVIGKMRFAWVDPHKIQVPKVRVTAMWDPEEYEVFKASIEGQGIEKPLNCIKEGQTWWLADGLHRLEEAKLKGLKRVPVVFKEGSLVDAKLRNLYLDRLRGKHKASEEVKLLKSLFEDDGLSLDQIHEKTRIPLERIEQRLAISKADPYVQEALDHEKIGVGIAFQLARLPNPEGQVKLLAEILKMVPPPTTAWVRDVVDASLKIIQAQTPPEERPKPTVPIPTLKCGFCAQEWPMNKMVGVNLCRSCAGLSEDYIKELMRKRHPKVTEKEALAQRVVEASPTEGSPP